MKRIRFVSAVNCFRKETVRFLSAWVLLLTFASPASAVLLFVDNEAAYNAAVAALTFAGTEDFESSTLGPNLATNNFTDPLAPGVANGPFPTGTNPATGLTVQSNTLAGMPVMVSPRGLFGLGTASAGFFGTPTDQVSNSAVGDSFDMLFGLTNTFAVSFNPLVFDQAATAGVGAFDIRVFDTSNTLILGPTQITAAAFTNPTTHVGIVAMAGEDIGRINLFGTGSIAGGGTVDFTGADNINVYTAGQVTPPPTIPEPATLALFGLGLAGLGFSRRRKV
jgi:hypothetical protein